MTSRPGGGFARYLYEYSAPEGAATWGRGVESGEGEGREAKRVSSRLKRTVCRTD